MNKLRNLIGIVILSSLLVPSLVYANGNKGNRNGENESKNTKVEKHEEKKQNKEEKKEKKIEKKTEQKDCLAMSWKRGGGWGWGRYGFGKDSRECREIRQQLWKDFIAQWKASHGYGTTTSDTIAPTLSSISVSGITNVAGIVNWTTNENATGRVYYGTTSGVTTASPSVGTAVLSTSHSFALTSLSANTPYYFLVESKDASGNTVLSAVQSFATLVNADATAPVLSSLVVSGITNVAAAVSWNTDELATTRVYYGTTSALSTSSASVGTNALTLAHLGGLSALQPNTLYYFYVESKDSTGNTALSAVQSFTTLVSPDVTAPILSAVIISPLASTSATLSWNTNEPATGKVYYGTTSPFVLLGSMSVGTTTLSTGHNFTLADLFASTTYRFVVESKDAATNIATSSELSFTTAN